MKHLSMKCPNIKTSTTYVLLIFHLSLLYIIQFSTKSILIFTLLFKICIHLIEREKTVTFFKKNYIHVYFFLLFFSLIFFAQLLFSTHQEKHMCFFFLATLRKRVFHPTFLLFSYSHQLPTLHDQYNNNIFFFFSLITFFFFFKLYLSLLSLLHPPSKCLFLVRSWNDRKIHCETGTLKNSTQKRFFVTAINERCY